MEVAVKMEAMVEVEAVASSGQLAFLEEKAFSPFCLAPPQATVEALLVVAVELSLRHPASVATLLLQACTQNPKEP